MEPSGYNDLWDALTLGHRADNGAPASGRSLGPHCPQSPPVGVASGDQHTTQLDITNQRE